jgi:hypothetical protein
MVFAIGIAWELFDVYGRGEVVEGWSAARTLRFNARVWRWIAGVEALTVFIFRLSDVSVRRPSWRLAWASGAWLGVASVVVANVLEEGHPRVALLIALVAAVAWVLLQRLVIRRTDWWHARSGALPAFDREQELR